jgi:hypothetical protein
LFWVAFGLVARAGANGEFDEHVPGRASPAKIEFYFALFCRMEGRATTAGVAECLQRTGPNDSIARMKAVPTLIGAVLRHLSRIIMTTFAAILAMCPLLNGLRGVGSVRRPLTAVMVSGPAARFPPVLRIPPTSLALLLARFAERRGARNTAQEPLCRGLQARFSTVGGRCK